MSGKSLGLLIVLGLAIIIGSQSLYVVKETESALTLQFGQIVENDIPAGLHVKTPFLPSVSTLKFSRTSKDDADSIFSKHSFNCFLH